MNIFFVARNAGTAPVCAAIGLAVTCLPLFAADFPERIAIAERSAESGVGVAVAPLLRRVPGPGAGLVTEQLLKDFAQSTDPVHTRGNMRVEGDKQKTTVFGARWSLNVYADGTRVKYRNYEYLDGPNNKPVPLDARLSQQKLERLGRDFVTTKLDGYVVLGKNEDLVPYFTEFQISGAGSTARGAAKVPESVHANTVIFTRAVGGVPILGPGSKIAIIFANNGAAIGFDMDWPVYQPTGAKQTVASLQEIDARTNKLFPFDLSAPDTKITRFECGYFDIGARTFDVNTPIQTACLVHAHKRQIVDAVAYAKDPNSGHTMAAHMGPIPAGYTIERDLSWLQTLTLLGIEPPKSDILPGNRNLQRAIFQ